MVVKTYEQFLEEYSSVPFEESNIPSGIKDPADSDDMEEVGPEIRIRPENHSLKLIVVDGHPSTDFSEMAILKDSTGGLYLLQFDASEEEFQGYKNRMIVGYDSDESGNKEPEYEYGDISADGVEAIAHDIPSRERGEGVKDFPLKYLIKLDGEAIEATLEILNDIIKEAPASIKKPYEVMKKAVEQNM